LVTVENKLKIKNVSIAEVILNNDIFIHNTLVLASHELVLHKYLSLVPLVGQRLCYT